MFLDQAYEGYGGQRAEDIKRQLLEALFQFWATGQVRGEVEAANLSPADMGELQEHFAGCLRIHTSDAPEGRRTLLMVERAD